MSPFSCPFPDSSSCDSETTNAFEAPGFAEREAGHIPDMDRLARHARSTYPLLLKNLGHFTAFAP